MTCFVFRFFREDYIIIREDYFIVYEDYVTVREAFFLKSCDFMIFK